MSRCVIVPFFNYGYPGSDILYKYFLLHSKQWSKYVDHIYAVDSGIGLSASLDPKIIIIKKPAQSHWQNMNEMIREIRDENILLLDSDMIIYKPEIVDKYFKDIENGVDVKAIFDNSGSQLFGLPNNNKRIAPYLCFLRKSALPSNFDFTPTGGENWTDSMGMITQQMVGLKRILSILPDDRSNIYLNQDGSINSEQWQDDRTIPENPDFGYYHIRNFGGALKIIQDKDFGLVPYREANRLLAWAKYLGDKTGTFFDYSYIYGPKFRLYLNKFIYYYPWLENI